MKKVLSIFLFACFAIYHFGYYAFYFSYDQHLESKWEDKIYGEQAVELQQMLIEIPLTAPYMANQEEFHPTNTSYEKDGQYFRAIKQRYQNDTLQVIVVPDTARGLLDNTVKKWISFLTEDEIPQEQNGKTTINLVVKDYLQPVTYDLTFDQAKTVIDTPESYFFSYSDPFFQVSSPPPEIA